MNDNIKERQHVVPQFYLKSFAVEIKPRLFKIFCYFKQHKNLIKRLEVENVAVKKFFYDDRYPPQPIENYLSITEGDLSKTYHKVIREQTISTLNEKEKIDLIYLTYFQYVRTEYMREKTIQLYNDILQKEKSDYLRDHTIEEWTKFNEFSTTKHSIRVHKLLIVLDDGYVRHWSKEVSQSLLNIMKTLLNLKKRILNTLRNLDLILLEIKDESQEFYTNDHPILFYSKQAIEDDEGMTFLDILDQHTQVYYPLSPKLCLKFYNRKVFTDYKTKYPEMKKELYKSDIKEIILINRLVTHEAYRMIFSKTGRFNVAQKYLEENPKFRDLHLRRFLKE